MSRTAYELVWSARYMCGEVAPDQYRDGFSDDTNTDVDVIPFLEFVNIAQRKLAQAGWKTQDVAITLIPGKFEYGVTQTEGRTLFVEYRDIQGVFRELMPRTTAEIRRVVGDLRARPSSVPTVYSSDYRDRILIFPCPLYDGTVTIRCGSTPNELVNKTDVPDSIPERLHDALAFMAALFWTVSNSESEATYFRQSALLRFVETYADDLKDVIDAKAMLQTLSRDED